MEKVIPPFLSQYNNLYKRKPFALHETQKFLNMWKSDTNKSWLQGYSVSMSYVDKNL